MKQNSGQALLLVLLGMSVILTIALSILSSSVVDVKVTANEQDALRAFSAAEAGIEKALVAGSAANGSINGSSFTAVYTAGATSTSYLYPANIISGDTATIWLVNHAADESLVCDATHLCFTGKTIKFCWGNSGTAAGSSTTPAIEIAVLYLNTPGDYSTVRIARATYDPNSSRTASNFFSAPDAGACTISGAQYAFQKTVDLSTLGVPIGVYNVANGLQMARVRLLYNTSVAHPLAIDTNFAGNANFPPQAIRIESTGTSGESTRKVEVFKGYADLPPIFDGVIFTSPDIVK